MAFNVPNFGGANLTPHVGGGRSHGAGLQTAMFILNAIDRFTKPDPDVEHELKSATSKAFEPGVVEELQPAVGPVKKAAYESPEDVQENEPYAASGYQNVGEIPAKPAVWANRGKALEPKYTDVAKRALDARHERELAGQALTDNRNQKNMQRYIAADRKAREVYAELESITPQGIKLGETYQEVGPGGAKRIAVGDEKVRPGEVIVRAGGTDKESIVKPAGDREPPEKSKHVVGPLYDDKGRQYYDVWDTVAGEYQTRYTGKTGKPPGREDSGKVHHSELVILRDKDGKPLLDENGAEKIGRQWFDAHNAKVGQPQPVEVDATGKVRKGPDKIQAELAKNYDKVQIKAKDWEDAVQNPNNVGLRLINPKDGLPYLITHGGHGNVAVKVSK